MILDSVRIQAVELINEAVTSGAARFKACAELEISVRTYQRWIVGGNIKTDGRPNAQRPEPKNKLSEVERDNLLTCLIARNSRAYHQVKSSLHWRTEAFILLLNRLVIVFFIKRSYKMHVVAAR
jgi:hypothetical protein